MAVVDVVNAALYRLGATPITSLTDGSTNATVANAVYTDVYKEVFRAHDWRCLRRRAMPAYTNTTLTLSSAAVGTGVTATAGASHFTVDDIGRVLYEVDADGADDGGEAEITGYTSGTGVTVENTVAWTGAGPHAANRWRLEPQLSDDWTYEYVFPSNWLKVVSGSEGDGWAVERGRILADTSYSLVVAGTIYDDTETNWDALLKQAVIARLAAELAAPITGDPKNAKEFQAHYYAALGQAIGRDQQDTSAQYRTPTFVSGGR